jgi:hypothetical protein
MPDFFIKQNDTSPVFQATLRGPAGNGENLTGAQSVVFKMANSVQVVKVNQAVTIDDALNGLVSYEWQVGDTDTSGTFFAEFEVIKADGKRETFPNTDPINVVIKKDVV